MRCNIILSYLLFFIAATNFAQNNAYKKRVDSLSNKSYEELTALIFNKKADSLLVKLSTESYLLKAKKNKDTIKLCTALYFKTVTLASEEENLQLYDSIIKLSLNLKNKNFPTIAYFEKGVQYYNARKFKLAFDNYLFAIKHNDGSNKENLEYLINQNIASLKNRIDYDSEATMLYKKCLKYAEEKGFKKIDPSSYFFLLSSLAHSLRKENKLDSATFYNTKALKAASKTEFKYNYYHLILNDGVINYYKKKYNHSFDSLVKGLEYLKSIDDKPNVAVGHYYLGKLYLEFNEIEKAIQNFKSVDTIFQSNRDILPETRESYKFISNYYKNKKDLTNELLYIERLIEVDSVLANNYKFLSKEINYEYDRPKLLSEKEKLIREIKSEKNNYLIVFVIILLIFIGFYFYKQKLNKQKLEDLLNRSIIQSEHITNVEKPNNLDDIKDSLINDIIRKLGDFEKNKGFLEPNISLNSLAKKTDTNTKYLSNVINHLKQKNFRNYINDLRIEYGVNKLKNDLVFRNYTIKAIANELGFKSAESFSSSFHKNTGIKPSYFIKNIK